MKIILIIAGFILMGFVVVQLFAFKSQRNIETYNYIVQKKYDSFEIRTYEKTLFTTVQLPTSDFKNSSGKGFSVLAGYIFGGNDRNEKISMTSPVAMSIEDSMTMMFMVPKKYSLAELPKPNNSLIKFRELPSKTVAAICFSGWANDLKIEKYKRELILSLEKEGINYTDQFYFFGYNAPYELFNRRNEIIVELQQD